MLTKVIVLCAGKGKRMKSEKSKVMHNIMGRPIIDYIYEVSTDISDKKPLFVVGHRKDQIQEYFEDRVEYVEQKEQLGTGHAIIITKDNIQKDEDVLILCGDTPLIKKETIQNLIKNKKDSDAVILTSIIDNPFGYGRIIKDEKGDFKKIVEQKDASEKEQRVNEINAGMYLVKGSLIIDYIDKLTNNNSQKEYYITDLFEILKKENKKITTFNIDRQEILGINSRVQLEQARKIMRTRINDEHMQNGVTLIDPDSIYIEKDVQIGQDTTIYPNNIITGNTQIGKDCVLYAENEISNTIIKDKVTIRKSFLEDSFVDEETTIGPYVHLRPKAKLGKKVKIGNFVEVKNTTMGNKSKASHLAYVGDSEVGNEVNIGCGVVFVNYDGKNKNRSIIKDKAFIGSNSNIVAPVTIEEKGYIATGSTVTDDVPQGALCIARVRQVIKANWTNKKGLLD